MQRTTHWPSPNWLETTGFSSGDHHHGIDVGGDYYGGSSSMNVKEDQDQPMMGGDDDKTSQHKMGIKWARNKLHSFHIHIWNRRREHDSIHIQLCEAATRGDWKAAEEIEKKSKGILSEVISKDRKETALHIATRFNKAAFVEKLIKYKLTQTDLEAKNIYGNTALCIAATSGAVDIAELMFRKHNDLVLTRGSANATPVLIAARYKHSHMVSFLLKSMNKIVQKMEISEQMELLLSAIASDHYDIAFLIIEWNKSLALIRDSNDYTPLHIMARKSNGTIGTKNNPTKWQSSINKFFKHVYKNKMMQIKAHQTVELMWSAVREKVQEDNNWNCILHPSSMLHDAASVGNVEFVRVVLNQNPELLRVLDGSGKSIFHVAVENRQRRIFNLIYDMKLFNPDDLLYYFNEENISLLELAAKRADPGHLDRVSGAVFQMHRELLWFKEVEDIAERTMRIKQRKKTPQELFTQEHRQLVKEAEKWVKSTANSCMLVATLIATVVFTAAFTVPGGNNDNNGFPLFLHHKWFIVFVISDSIALISSSTAILLFLSILTSRCVETDFLFWLPLELVFGLGFLFLSVLGMVLAFSACLFLHYGKDHFSWIPLLISGMTIVPIFWFCMLQWKLWADGLAALHATGMSYLLKDRKNKVF
ncbi:ankyrin repeat-containing protein At5g02620 isoform X1 [Cucumis sativus]|uniref:ankyrin repeat-containing protein At5g02620 isoform X1 n=1 Tax=Cucumis sativus TaxID=3659 RepID=UPI0012F4C27C|nr:ankyrin repeat-containing protein At5g02620 isoform X1 [Cucumis sativus]